MSFTAQTWRNQRERRYHPTREHAGRALRELAARLPVVCYGDSDTSFVVTTYLDTSDGHYLERARVDDGHQSLKLRIREYLSHDPAAGAYRFADECYVERKERHGEVRLKERIRVPKRDVARILSGDQPVPGDGPEARAIRAELAVLRLHPVLVSAYERRVFGYEQALRVTFDERVAYYTPPRGLYELARALTPEVLGPPRARGPSRILEVKQPSDDRAPAWLDALLANLVPEPAYSKFSDGMRALAHSDGDPVELTRRLAPIR